MKEKPKKLYGYISRKGETQIRQDFSGEVDDVRVKWPKELGTEHPFKFEECEEVFKKVGLVSGAMSKISENIVGEFAVQSKNPNILKLVEDFINENNLPTVLREWVIEALVKGNGFLEVDLKQGKVKVLNANSMYVLRDKKGNILGYNQYKGDVGKFNPSSRKLIPFKPNQIAHLKINTIAGEAYGLGLVWPNERVIENIVAGSQDYHKLVSRKAGAPIHAKVGMPGENADQDAIDSFKVDLQYMNNRTEWVTDANVDLKVIDFGDIGKNLSDLLRYDFLELIAGFDIPEVLMNSGQLNEGIARTQLEGWRTRITSYQDKIEWIIVQAIFKPWLKEMHSLGTDDLDFIWNLPGDTAITTRIEMLARLMGTSLTDNMKNLMELEIARLLNIDNAESVLGSPDPKNAGVTTTALNPNQINPDTGQPHTPPEKPNAQRQAENNMPQPKVPGAKAQGRVEVKEQPSVPQKAVQNEQEDVGALSIKQFMDLKEMRGFTYSDYLISILKAIKKDNFSDLRALTEADVQNGLLPDSDIEKLRTILKDGFKNNLTIREIEQRVKDNLNLKDRIAENGALLPASSRPELISRTEVARLSNQGLVDLYVDNGIQKVRWAASYSERTCQGCGEQLDGQIREIGQGFTSEFLGFNGSMPPAHPNCRCSLFAE